MGGHKPQTCPRSAPGGIRTPDQELRRLLLCPLSYRGKGPHTRHPVLSASACRAGEGNRTLTTSLEGWGSTIELHPPVPGQDRQEASSFQPPESPGVRAVGLEPTMGG